MRTGVEHRPAGASLRLVVNLVGVATVLAACGFVPSAYRMDLFKSAWTVTTLDGKEVAGPITISFNDGGVVEVVTVASPCGAVQWGFSYDTDGDGISFGGDTRPDGPCADTARGEASAVLDALVEVDGWQVRDDNHITLIGEPSSPPSIELTRVR